MDNDQLSTINYQLSIDVYDAYKDSGIEWLGEVPAHWDLKRFKDFVYILSGYSPEEVKPDLQGNTAYYKVDDLNSLSKTGHITQSTWHTNYKKCVYKKDILLLPKRGMSILTNKVGITNTNCIFDTNLMGLRLLPKYVDIKFIFYWTINVGLAKLADITTIPQLNNKHIYPIDIQLPKRAEQAALATYLDSKTAQIDRQIDLFSQKATQYGKLKQSLINETVTRGLDKTVPMKASGVEWIGEIPAHWEVKRVKEVFSESKFKSTTGDETLLSVSEYTGVTQKQDNVGEDEFLTNAESLVGYKICKVGNLVINIMLAWKRGLGVSSFYGIVSPSYAVYAPLKKINSAFFHYLLRSEDAIIEFKRNSTGIIESRLRLYSDSFYALSVAVPSFEEQAAIATYLDEKTAQIDRIVATINSQIDRLRELRKTLINDVVTGKIKVA